jgi:hypothetical protein
MFIFYGIYHALPAVDKYRMDDNTVSSVEHARKKDMQVIWTLGNTCPYKCTYCSPAFNDGSSPFHPYDNVMSILNQLPTNASVFFSGGEPTYHPDFEKILDNKPTALKLNVISNGARPYSFWERVVPKLSRIILTFHAEFAKLDRFIDVATLCKPKLDRINLTMIPWKWEECVEAYNTLISHGLPVTPKPLVKDFGYKASSLIDEYSIDQLKWIDNKGKSEGRAYIGFYRKDGSAIKFTTPGEMLVSAENNFNNWLCYTPTVSRHISFNGNIYDMGCSQRQLIGTITDGITIDPTPVICKQNFCWSYPDMEGKKEKQ